MSTRSGAGFMEVAFTSGGIGVRDVWIFSAALRDGKPFAGGGRGLGDLDTGTEAALYDSRLVDRSSIGADFAIEQEVHTTQAIFATWLADVRRGHRGAVGFEVEHSDEAAFTMVAEYTGDAALQRMKELNMGESPGLGPSPAPVPIPHEFAPVSENTYFTELSIGGYRGFAQRRTLRLARPNGKAGSGLTVLVGANNSGKSTFLEGLDAIARARRGADLSFPQPQRHRDIDSVEIELRRSDGRSLKIETVRVGSSQARAEWLPGAGADQFDVQMTPSRRNFSPYFGNMGTSDRDWAQFDSQYSRTQLRENFVGRLRKVDRDPDARKVFDRLLTEMIGRPLNWTIDEITTSQQFLKLTEPDGTAHTSEGLGDGLVSLLFIVDAIYDSKPGSLIAVDEPELSLHPQLVRRLRSVLSRTAKDRQIVLATHSPLLLDWTDIGNGATVARIFKVDGRSEIAQATEPTLGKVATLAASRNRSNPHTLGTTAGEAFFLEDGIILTEGQDDVVHLPIVLEDLGIEAIDNRTGGVPGVPPISHFWPSYS